MKYLPRLSRLNRHCTSGTSGTAPDVFGSSSKIPKLIRWIQESDEDVLNPEKIHLNLLILSGYFWKIQQIPTEKNGPTVSGELGRNWVASKKS